jgi:tetratricopeptide (TPR) repeat protein
MTFTSEPAATSSGARGSQRLDPVALDALWDFADPAGSEQRLRGAIDLAPADSTEHAELTTQLARALGLQHRFDDARALLDVVALRGCADPIVGIRLSLERGRLLNSSGSPAAAIEHFIDALGTARSSGEDFLEVDAAHMLAISDRAHSDDWTAQALRAVGRSQDPRTQRWAGSLHNNAGWARHDAGDYAAALEEFEAALTAYALYGTVEQVRVARWAVARALRSLARFDEALQIQLRLAAHGPADGYVEEELTELLLATGRREDAAAHAAAAVELLAADSWFAEYESGRLERLRQIAANG